MCSARAPQRHVFFCFFFCTRGPRSANPRIFRGRCRINNFFGNIFSKVLPTDWGLRSTHADLAGFRFPSSHFVYIRFYCFPIQSVSFFRYLVCDCHSFDRLQCIANAGYPRKTRFLRFHRRDVWFFLSFLSCTNSCLRFCAGRILEFGNFLL